MTNTDNIRTALITGGSDGLGRALARSLVEHGWHPIITARGAARLHAVRVDLGSDRVTAVSGDVTEPEHRIRIAEAILDRGRLDLVVNNASQLGPSPMPRLADFPLDELAEIYETNVIAPLGILQLTMPLLRRSGGLAINISSDAAIGAYEGWGGYGPSKAALDHLTAIFAAENPDIRTYAFDPGDMRTEMHQAAFPDEDISDRPEPKTVIPALLRLIENRPPSGRYLGSDLLAQVPA